MGVNVATARSRPDGSVCTCPLRGGEEACTSAFTGPNGEIMEQEHRHNATPGYCYSLGMRRLVSAAKLLKVKPRKLAALCEREATRSAGLTMAQLERGVIAFYIEGKWKFRFPIGFKPNRNPRRGR